MINYHSQNGIDGEETGLRRTERGTNAESALRSGTAVPLPSRPGRPGRGFPVIERHERLVVTLRLLAARGFPPTWAGVWAFGPPLALASVHPRGSRRLSAAGKQGGTVGRLTSSTPHP